MQNIFLERPKETWDATAKKIVDGDIAIDDHHIPMLLEWLRDCNWPGADTISEYLVSHGEQCIEPTRRVLKSNDSIWINWVIRTVISKWAPSLQRDLSGELWNTASQIDEEEAYLSAIEVLCSGGFEPTEKLRNFLLNRKEVDAKNEEFYQHTLDSLS